MGIMTVLRTLVFLIVLALPVRGYASAWEVCLRVLGIARQSPPEPVTAVVAVPSNISVPPPSIPGLVDFTGTKRFNGGGQADIYLDPDTHLIYRVPRKPGERLDSLYEKMSEVVGDQMPRYHGSRTVRVKSSTGTFEQRTAYVFDLMDLQKFTNPSLENFRATPPDVRRKVAASLEALREKMEARGYFPGDMNVNNYVFDPKTGDVAVFPDSGVFLPVTSPYIEEHRQALARQIKRWQKGSSDFQY